jgi:predicted ArsR family transcriptional regulator
MSDRPEDLEALGALSDPMRRRVFDVVCASEERMGRDDVAAATGISRSLAAYHLDKLAAEGLVTVGFERRSGRSGPGAGRPAKLYARSERELAVSLPPRDYGLAALLLAEAAAGDLDGGTGEALREAAGRLGRQAAAEAGDAPADVEQLLRSRGYDPRLDADGVLRLHNCPFHVAARRHPDVVCAMNHALLGSLLTGLRVGDREAVLEPAPGRCCVAIRPPARRADP